MNLRGDILRLAVPSILANITIPLVGMVDIAVAGHLGASLPTHGATFIGGISIGSMLFDLLYWNFAFLRAGTGGLTAQAFGRGDHGAASATLRRALGIALLSGIVLIALQWLVVQGAFLVVKCSPQVRELATQYFYIRIWAAPATLSLFAFKGWLIGMQDTVRPMVADLLVNLVNIFFSAGLALGLFGLPAIGFRGIAIGTVIAQWSGFLYAGAAVLRRYRDWVIPEGAGRTIGAGNGDDSGESIGARSGEGAATGTGAGAWRDFFTLNRDLVLRSLGMIAVYIGFTVLSARFGDVVLAVSAILMKLLMFFSYFTDGFAYAGEALTGRFIGEGSREGIRATVRGTFQWSGVIAVLFMLVYGLGGEPLLRLMTMDSAVIGFGKDYLPWLLLMPVTGCAAFTWDGIFIGATASRDLRNSTLLCAVGFFAVWLTGIALVRGLLTDPETAQVNDPERLNALALHVLMAAYFMHLAIRALYLTLRYRPAILSRH